LEISIAFFSTLARSFLGGEQTVEAVIARAAQTLGREWRWLTPVARRYVQAFSGQTRPRRRDVIEFLRRDRTALRAGAKFGRRLAVARWLAEPQLMQPVEAAAGWDLPCIETAGALAEWLWIDANQLDWFADLAGLTRKNNSPKLQHYRYKVLTKQSGGVRVIEAPKLRLKKLQRQILEWILERIPTHEAAHGFVKGRSIKTFVTPHTGKHAILRMDLRDFFPSFSRARIQAFFRTAGYPESVADLLGGICTNAVPRSVIPDRQSLYARPHLPQGAPASPSLANACVYRADCRLAGLARSAGAAYTRYADDLAFSGGEDFARSIERFATHTAAILHEEGFSVNHRKTRVMRQGVRQHLAGLTVNEKPNVRRSDFDALRALLTNCVRFGPASQNRDSHTLFRPHLEGRVAFVESIHAAKGARLRAIFDRIAWE